MQRHKSRYEKHKTPYQIPRQTLCRTPSLRQAPIVSLSKRDKTFAQPGLTSVFFYDCLNSLPERKLCSFLLNVSPKYHFSRLVVMWRSRALGLVGDNGASVSTVIADNERSRVSHENKTFWRFLLSLMINGSSWVIPSLCFV